MTNHPPPQINSVRCNISFFHFNSAASPVFVPLLLWPVNPTNFLPQCCFYCTSNSSPSPSTISSENGWACETWQTLVPRTFHWVTQILGTCRWVAKRRVAKKNVCYILVHPILALPNFGLPIFVTSYFWDTTSVHGIFGASYFGAS